MSTLEWVPVVARVVVGAVLIYAGVSKLRSRSWALLAIETGTPRMVAMNLPVVEALLGLALILQLGGGLVAWVTVALFVIFTGVVARQYLSGSQEPCRCFGSSEGDPVGPSTIVRNVVLLAVAVIATQ